MKKEKLLSIREEIKNSDTFFNWNIKFFNQNFLLFNEERINRKEV